MLPYPSMTTTQEKNYGPFYNGQGVGNILG